MWKKDKIARKDKLKNQVVVHIKKKKKTKPRSFIQNCEASDRLRETETRTIINKMLKTIDQATRESKGWSLQEFQCHSPLHRENAENTVDVQEMKKGTWGGGGKAQMKTQTQCNTPFLARVQHSL